MFSSPATRLYAADVDMCSVRPVLNVIYGALTYDLVRSEPVVFDWSVMQRGEFEPLFLSVADGVQAAS